MTPASSTIVVSSQDTAIMFMPNSPRPPRGTTSSVAGALSGMAVDVIRCPAFARDHPEPGTHTRAHPRLVRSSGSRQAAPPIVHLPALKLDSRRQVLDRQGFSLQRPRV